MDVQLLYDMASTAMSSMTVLSPAEFQYIPRVFPLWGGDYLHIFMCPAGKRYAWGITPWCAAFVSVHVLLHWCSEQPLDMRSLLHSTIDSCCLQPA